jgi:hypothetical protein
MNTAVQRVLMTKVAGRTGGVFLVLNGYAIVQHAADSANNLKKTFRYFTMHYIWKILK